MIKLKNKRTGPKQETVLGPAEESAPDNTASDTKPALIYSASTVQETAYMHPELSFA